MKKILLLVISLISASTLSAQNLIWAKKLGGSSDEYGRSIAVDAAGNVYSAGYFSGTTDFDPGLGTATLTASGVADIYVTKMDANGNFLWAKKMGSGQEDNGFGIAVDGTGNVYTTGCFRSISDFDPGVGTSTLTSNGLRDVFICKLDASGNFVWAKQIGGSNEDIGYQIAVDASNNVYTCGYFTNSVDFDPSVAIYNLTALGGIDMFISKLDAAGNFVWAKRMGSSNGDVATCIAVDASSNVYTSGYYQGTTDFDPGAGTYTLGTAGFHDVFVSKLDVAGNFVWASKMGGGGTDVALDIDVDASGNVLTTGYFNNTPDFDPGTGTFTITSLASSDDAFISKLDASGNFVWAKRLGGASYEAGNSITTDASGNVYTTGYYSSSADFDPGAASFSLTAVTGPGSYDVFVSKLDATGNFVWAKSVGGGSNDIGYAIACNTAGDVHITGSFATTADFDPNAGVFNLATSGLNDVFVLKMGAIGTDIIETKSGIEAIVYPNPAFSTLTVRTKQPVESVCVYNLLGEMVMEEKNSYFSIEHLPNGVYTLQIRTSNGIGTTRLIKQ